MHGQGKDIWEICFSKYESIG